MIKIENIVTPSPKQFEAVIRGLRNPMNSWSNSDSYITHIEDEKTLNIADFEFILGVNDLNLMKKLSFNGPVHGKFCRMITVYMDITAPLYWWKEFDTYKIGTVTNSCSTMHKIHEKEFTIDDFSHDNLFDFCPYEDNDSISVIKETISWLNKMRKHYIETNDKKYWWQMIQLLPSSYNQKRTVLLNYEVLSNIYKYRKNHKLNEWLDFCRMIEKLPYNELIIRKEKEDDMQ